MDRKYKYSYFTEATGLQEVKPSNSIPPKDINNISEKSTPKEMSELISLKLVEFIEQQLKEKKED